MAKEVGALKDNMVNKTELQDSIDRLSFNTLVWQLMKCDRLYLNRLSENSAKLSENSARLEKLTHRGAFCGYA